MNAEETEGSDKNDSKTENQKRNGQNRRQIAIFIADL
jgi:hypothetical protein